MRNERVKSAAQSIQSSPHGSRLAAYLAHPRFEVVPIKGVEEQAGYLPRGATVTVTCSPTRGIENTLRVAERLAKGGLRVVPHISARLVLDESLLRDLLQELADLELREAFIIGGDAKRPAGRFASALDLLRGMAEIGHDLQEIGVAAYPEGHPLVDDASLRSALHEKQPFATYMVTQICFDANTIAAWLAGIREEGIVLPAYIGLAGVVDTKRLLQMSMKIGVGDSMRFLAKNTNVVAGLFGGYRPTELVDKLAPVLDTPGYAIHGLHLNTFNQVEGTERWREQMVSAATDT